jgi:hypothetical protein
MSAGARRVARRSATVVLLACAGTAVAAGSAQAGWCDASCQQPAPEVNQAGSSTPRPDLVVWSFSYFHHVTVRNIGNATAGPSTVRTYSSPFGYGHYRVGSLLPGAHQTIALRPGEWCTYGGQTLTVAARADAWDTVVESNETNNRREYKIVC